MRMPFRAGLALFCAAMLLSLVLQVLLHGPVVELDHDVSGWLARHRHAGLTTAMLLVSEAHETVKVLLVAALVAAWQGWRGRAHAVRALLVVPAAMLLNVSLKHLFQRARPVIDDPLVLLATYSFPSGHALASTVLYGTLWLLFVPRLRSRFLRVSATVLAAAMVLLVCFSRVYLGAHFPSDVTAGIALGLLCLLAARRLHVPSPAHPQETP